MAGCLEAKRLANDCCTSLPEGPADAVLVTTEGPADAVHVTTEGR